MPKVTQKVAESDAEGNAGKIKGSAEGIADESAEGNVMVFTSSEGRRPESARRSSRSS